MLLQYFIRPLLIAAGNQWFTIHGMDLVMVRRRNLIWIQLFMLFKTFVGTILSFASTVSYPADPSWRVTYYLMDSILTAVGFFFFTYTFSDDPAYVLGFVSIMEGLASICLLVLGLINVLERRQSPFELIGEIQLPDLLYPVLIVGLFYLLRPVLNRILHIIARMYQPHRGLQIIVLITTCIVSRIAIITDKSIGSTLVIILHIHALFILAVGIRLIRSDFRVQRQEKNLLDMQRGLLEKRAYLASHISGEAKKFRQEISRQMEQLQEELDRGNCIDRESLEQHMERLNALHFDKRRGIYCHDSLVDEILMQIREDAASSGMEARIRLHRYDRGNVTEEDLVQLLYYPWMFCQAEGGKLDIDIMAEGQRMTIRFASPAIHVSRARNTAIRSITRKFKGEISSGLGRRRKEITMWVKSK